MNDDSLRVDLRSLEEAISRVLLTYDMRLALWTAVLGPDRYDLEGREAVQEVRVSKVRRLSEVPDSRQHGVTLDTTDGGRWVMTIGARR